MSKYHYETPVDSPTGERISRFWQQCIKVEEAQQAYLKKMGATGNCLESAHYFAGGVEHVSFAADKKVDISVWRKSKLEDGIQYWEPNCECRRGETEVPSREYTLKDTSNRMYFPEYTTEREVANPDFGEGSGEDTPATIKKLFVPYLEFFRNESAGHSGHYSNPRQASRGLRKAIKAEMMRRRLPVVPPDNLLKALGFSTSEKVTTTPTFFPFRSRYFIGCDYDCSANQDLKPISKEIYKMNADKARLEANRGWA